MTPITKRPAIKVPTFGAEKSHKEPPANKKSEMMIEIFLPYLSAIGPTIKDPIAPPIAVIDIINYLRMNFIDSSF